MSFKKLTMNWLVDTIASTLPIRNPAQTRTGKQADTARNNTRLVTNNISKEITRDHHAIERPRLLDHEHSSTVDQMMSDFQLRELLLNHIRDRLPPQSRRRQHIRLIQRPDRQRRVMSQRQMRRQPRNPLDLRARVRLRVPGDPIAVILLPLAEVDAPRQLPHDHEVHAPAHGGLERRAVDQRLGREVARPQVAICPHLLAQREDALLGAHRARTPFRAADGAQQHRVGGFGGFEGLGGQRLAGGID